MPRVYLSLGSNIDREANLRSAIRLLRERFGELTISAVYQNQAVGFEGDDFYNLVVGLDTDEPVEQLNAWLAEVENRHGRDRSAPKFGPRSLDIDLLLYDDLVYRNGKLSLPRDDINKYAFVLGPLAEIAGDMEHPQTHRRFRDMWQEFDKSSQSLKRIDIDW
jgi:2-amino-4-hydroxy-6-hydroxymethyldihydropteridine diphosphokinase